MRIAPSQRPFLPRHDHQREMDCRGAVAQVLCESSQIQLLFGVEVVVGIHDVGFRDSQNEEKVRCCQCLVCQASSNDSTADPCRVLVVVIHSTAVLDIHIKHLWSDVRLPSTAHFPVDLPTGTHQREAICSDVQNVIPIAERRNEERHVKILALADYSTTKRAVFDGIFHRPGCLLASTSFFFSMLSTKIPRSLHTFKDGCPWKPESKIMTCPRPGMLVLSSMRRNIAAVLGRMSQYFSLSEKEAGETGSITKMMFDMPQAASWIS